MSVQNRQHRVFAPVDRDVDGAFLRWHLARIANCDPLDPRAYERAMIDYVVALALSSRPEVPLASQP
jgi:hypothetical protein